jgi:CIC family chloride channel protein
MMIKVFATGITLELEETEVTLRPLICGFYLGYVFSKLINLTGLTQLSQ